MKQATSTHPTLTIGIDLGDRKSHICVLDAAGEIVEESRIATTPKALACTVQRSGSHAYCARGGHALGLGVRAPEGSGSRGDRGQRTQAADDLPERLEERSAGRRAAGAGRADGHQAAVPDRAPRSLCGRADLAVMRSRDALVDDTHAASESHPRSAQVVRVPRQEVRAPRLSPTGRGRDPGGADNPHCSRCWTRWQRSRNASFASTGRFGGCRPKVYPETALLESGGRSGSDHRVCVTCSRSRIPSGSRRAATSARTLGLRPRQRQSGQRDPELRITKAGDRDLRRLLVQCAQYILGPFGKDADLRQWGLKLASRGGATAKKKGCDRGGSQARRAAAPSVVDRRGVRTAAKHEPPRRRADTPTCCRGRLSQHEHERRQRGARSDL